MAGLNVYSAVTGVLGQSIETIEIRTRFSPPVLLRVADLVAQKEGPPNPAVSALKPTIILRGPAIGQQVVAPAGQVGPEDWKLPTATVVVVLGVGLFTLLAAAYKLGRKSR